MTVPISAGRLALLQLIARYPGVPKGKLLAIEGVGAADLDYLAALELVCVREPDRYRATHRGEMLVRRGL